MRGMNYVLTKLLYLSPERSLLYVTDMSKDGQLSHVFEHLSCFLPGLLALGVQSLPSSAFNNSAFLPSQESILTQHNLSELHMSAALGLGESCWLMYADQPTGLGPEEILMAQPASRDRSGTFNMSSGLWIDSMEQWRISGRQGTPPGIEQKDPEPDAAKRDYELRKPAYFLRPEVRDPSFCHTS